MSGATARSVRRRRELNQHADDGGGNEVGSGAGEHGFDADTGEVVFAIGAVPTPPIWMPMELRLAKPQRAKVVMVKLRGERRCCWAPRLV